MNCLLDELKQGLASDTGTSLDKTTDANGKGNDASSSSSPFMREFFVDVEIVQGLLNEVKDACREIESIQHEVEDGTESDVIISERLNPVVKRGNKKAGQIKVFIDRLRESTNALTASMGGDSGETGFGVGGASSGNPKPTSEIIIRENLLNNLTRQCVDWAQRLQKKQQDCQVALKQKRRRHILVANPDLSSEDVDAAVLSGLSGDVLRKTIMEGKTISDAVQAAKTDADDQYRQMLELEASVVELHSMFSDLSFLVEQQGEMLNSIQRSVEMTSMYLDEGNALYDKAVDSRVGISMMFLAPGLVIRNESEAKILVVLSQLTPLHWEAINPGDTIRMKCGRVFFTVSAEIFDEKKVPKKSEVAARIAGIAASTTVSALTGPIGLVAGAAAGLTLSGTLSGITSVKEASINGVYADGKTVVFGGRWNHDTKEYCLYCDGTEKTPRDQKFNRPAIIKSELMSTKHKSPADAGTLDTTAGGAKTSGEEKNTPGQEKEKEKVKTGWRPGMFINKMKSRLNKDSL